MRAVCTINKNPKYLQRPKQIVKMNNRNPIKSMY